MKLLQILIFVSMTFGGFAQMHTCENVVFPTHESSLYQGVFFQDHTWPAGQRISVCFLEGSDHVKSKVMQYAKEWCKHGNFNFEFVSNRDADIRISFRQGKGSWSLIGNESKQFSVNPDTGNSYVGRGGPSMNFGWFNSSTTDEVFKRTTLHEFGHALGLLHEHKSPNSGIKWNKPKVYAYYMQKNGWSKDQIDRNILGTYSVGHTNDHYDPNSVMHYPIPNDFTLNDHEVGWNTSISSGDQAVIAKLYPFYNDPNDPENPTVVSKPLVNYRITGLSYGDGVWSLVTSKSQSSYAQSWRTRTYFPSEEIKELWDDNYKITNLTYGNGVWGVVMSKDSKFGAQLWRTRSHFPENEIKEAWDDGYRVTNLSYGNGEWAFVASKGSGYGAQRWRTRTYFPKDEIKEAWDSGYRITSLTYGNGVWALVATKNTGFTGQVWRTRAHYPKDEIAELWEQGYFITSLEFGNGIWSLVMSKGAQFTQQTWRTRTNFPKEEISELWEE